MPAASPPARGAQRLDPRRPLVLDMREISRRPGAMRAVRRTVPAPDSLGLELARVPEGAPLELDLRLESVVEGVLVTGTATAPVTGECARCLSPVTDEVTAEIQELYAYEDSTTEETTEEDEVSHLVGDLVDLEPVVRDAVVLALPLSPLCRDDCRGLCVECGAVLNELPADHSHPVPIDPRWAALADRGSTDSQE
jgi:uncharacterized protein